MSPPSPPQTQYPLTPAQKSHFLEHGYIKLTSCFSRQQAEEFTKDLWTRLGVDENDKSTWIVERTNMTSLNYVNVREFAPRAWGGILGLLAPESIDEVDGNWEEGEERERVREWEKEVEDMIDEGKKVWGDGFIVNLGKKGWESEVVEGEENARERGERLRGLDGWHVDGDFFVHYLDSPEQALLVIPLWSDIEPQGGGTAIATDSVKHIAQHLYNHPEGVTPWFNHPSNPVETRTWFQDLANDESQIRAESIIEATGKVGDVYLLHPFMLHSASQNLRRGKRVITNPPVSLKGAFGYGRARFGRRKTVEEGSVGVNEKGGGDGGGEKVYRREDTKIRMNLVERKTLSELGLETGGLGDWKIEGERRGWVSARMKRYEEARRVERERLKEKESK